MHPAGWDSFGLPAENAAIKRNEHPATWTYQNIETQAESFRRYAVSFDWSTRLHTSDPEYYRWTQWLFLHAATNAASPTASPRPVNWCPNDQTVLANEQVVAGDVRALRSRGDQARADPVVLQGDRLRPAAAGRHGAFARRWPARVLTMQRNWIGRSEGAHVDFEVDGPTLSRITVFTTRPDTLFGATFFVVAADAHLAAELCAPEQRAAFEDYLREVRRTSEIERMSEGRDKTGVFLGVYATNPVNGTKMPVYAADYVLADYGTGAIMAVPGQDQRDWDFATCLRPPGGANRAAARTASMARPSPVTVRPSTRPTPRSASTTSTWPTPRSASSAWLEDQGRGRRTVNFRLRDWLVSRQRFWGPPIPIVHCPACGEVPVPLDELPVVLPDLAGADLKPRGVSPLASATDWVNVSCPTCGGPATRDTDTMDTFVDSSWYYLRYPTAHDEQPALRRRGGTALGTGRPVRRWRRARDPAPAVRAFRHQGAARHGLPGLHASRFTALLNQGEVRNQGKGMAKSLGNGVDLGEQIAQFGVDAVRLTMVFAGPPEEDIDWADMSPARLAQVPAACLAAERRRHQRSGNLARGGRCQGCARSHTRTINEATQLLDGTAVQRDGGPGDGAGQRHPQGDRLRLWSG
ncbi:MAG: class I tRNA ligase family protein [Nocardioidaceae bacterium]